MVITIKGAIEIVFRIFSLSACMMAMPATVTNEIGKTPFFFMILSVMGGRIISLPPSSPNFEYIFLR